MRVVSQRELNRAVLARQLLLERAAVSLPRALEKMAGLQAQYAPSTYVGLWSRVADVQRDAVTAALERRTIVQGTLMRVTIHVVARRDYWSFALATRAARRSLWLRSEQDPPSAAEMEAAAETLRERLLTDGPLRRTELDALLTKRVARGVGLWIDLVRVPPSGTWARRRADLYDAAETWLGPSDVTDPAEAVEHLIRRYLGGFGPATAADVVSFTGLPPTEVSAALGRMRLRQLRSEAGDELLDLPRAPLPDAGSPAPVRFLPSWDASLLVHARRAGILPEEHRSKVFNTKMPQSIGTFLVDGAVAGTWKVVDGVVRTEPFAALDPATRRELDDEADRLTSFHA